jgi:hypothetical protein
MRGVCVVGLVVAALGLLGCASAKAKAPVAVAQPETWCPDAFEVGPDDTCFAVPASSTPKTPIVVFLHQTFDGRGDAEEWKRVHGLVDKGSAVVLVRGRRGVCAWKAELKDHFCWPEEDSGEAASIVGSWDKVLFQVDSVLETGAHRRYLVAQGDGANFASGLAATGTFEAGGFVLIDGGIAAPKVKPAKVAPVLTLASAGAEAQLKGFREALERLSWPAGKCARASSDSKITDADVESISRLVSKEGDLRAFAQGATGCEIAGAEPPKADKAPHKGGPGKRP